MNPLLSKFENAYNSAPFKKIKEEHFLPAFKSAIAEAKSEIDAICNNPDIPDFENTVAALDYCGQKLDRISSIFFNLNAAETNARIQSLAQEISPLLSEFSNDVTLNTELFKRIKSVYDSADFSLLNAEEKMLLEKKYRSFVRNGAELNEHSKSRLREIDRELGQLKLKFGENVLAETNAYQLHITEESDLSGLPQSSVEAAAHLAESKGLDGWLFTLDFPSYIPFMTYADNRELRKKMSLAYGRKGFQDNAQNNEEIVLRIAQLRHERAVLLGYETHAHFVLEERMAKSPETVQEFLKELLEKAKPAAKREFAQLSTFAKDIHEIGELQKWDGAYYSEKLKQELFNLDQEKLKPYFKLENVITGAFALAGKLFGLNFEEIDSVDVYHEDVKTYRITDETGEFKALFYADFFPRPGKRNGAWMTSYKPQYMENGINERPHISIVCNFTKPSESKPSLLTFNEVKTLFHEFGHALHGILANTTYPSLSGTNVYWDFVELPSQILENWCYEAEALRDFAVHYETGKPIPEEYINSLKASSTFLEGMQTLRQLSFGLLDMSWHGKNPEGIEDVKSHENNAFENTRLYPDCPENCMSTSFSHIFQGGYSSGYYSYKWAEVLDADAFEFFKESGIFDKKVAGLFRDEILSKGGTEDPMVLYKRFRGREPEPEALLRRAGLIES